MSESFWGQLWRRLLKPGVDAADAEPPMKLIVGLGNPGVEYEKTRHNVGFMLLDRLRARYAPAEAGKAKHMSRVYDARLAGEKVLLIYPMTYMNRSGDAIGDALRFYKLDPAEDLLVIVDDIALPCGKLRLRGGGRAGGHNGLKDIERVVGDNTYPRLRVGIDKPGRIPQRDYVLGRFTPSQLEALEPALDTGVDAVACWLEHGLEKAMSEYNGV